MRPIRVARIPYLNSVPFYQRPAPDGIEFVELPPRALGRAARQGDLDAGLMSVADGFRDAEFEPLTGLGISVDGAAHSVLLFSRARPEQLDGATIAVTEETSTSYPLLRMLLEQHYGVRAASYVRSDREAAGNETARLVIGNRALRLAASGGLEPGRQDYGPALLEWGTRDSAWGFVLDLAAAWKLWQGLPFTFARWMVRREVADERRRQLVELLEASLVDSMHRLQEIAVAGCDNAGLKPEAAYAYLMGFNYRLGNDELEAVRRFRELLESAPWWETAPPLVVQEGNA